MSHYALCRLFEFGPLMAFRLTRALRGLSTEDAYYVVIDALWRVRHPND